MCRAAFTKQRRDTIIARLARFPINCANATYRPGVAQFESSYGHHPERSRFSGGAKDLPRHACLRPREIPNPELNSAGFRNDAHKKKTDSNRATTVP
jgi:hypothetical protein